MKNPVKQCFSQSSEKNGAESVEETKWGFSKNKVHGAILQFSLS